MAVRKVAQAAQGAREQARRAAFTWDATAGRYRSGATGRFVGSADVRRATDEAIRAANRRIASHATALQSGEVSLSEWTALMRTEIKRVHLWNAAAARGGWAQMSAADFGRVGQIVRRQYEYLYRFAGAIEKGLPLDGRFVARAEMYGEAGRGTFEHVQRMTNEAIGLDQCRNRLGLAEHCPQCLAETARGWVPAREMSLPGSRLCRTRCKCRLEFRRSSTSTTRARRR